MSRIFVSAVLLSTLLVSSCKGGKQEVINLPDREGVTVDGYQEGAWVYRYPSGAISAQGDYKKDHQLGPWKYLHENGQPKWEGNFGSERLDGMAVTYDAAGKVAMEGQYVAGFESGHWKFFDDQHSIEAEGDFYRGLATLRWTSFYNHGPPKAEGFRWKGDPVGVWQYWDSRDGLFEKAYPMPDGLSIVYESWPNGAPRRMGFLNGKTKVGRWVSYHSNGNIRGEGDFGKGRASGVWQFWSPAGELLARGKMSGWDYSGSWTLRQDGDMDSVQSTYFPRVDPTRGVWTTDDLADGAGSRAAVAAWASELFNGAEPTVLRQPGGELPSQALLLASSARPRVPVEPQPWTTYERESIEALIDRYTVGVAEAKPVIGGGRRYNVLRAPSAPRKADELEAYGEVEKAEVMLGKELPYRTFYTGKDELYDLDDFRGKKPVALIVLRGFVREVCIYCVTQTKAIDRSIEEFHKRGVEVAIIYPGDQNRMETFLESFKSEVSLSGEPRMSILYDSDSTLVTELGIESELAIPSTILLDRDGIVRYAYVGRSIEDRPSAKEILAAIDKLKALQDE